MVKANGSLFSQVITDDCIAKGKMAIPRDYKWNIEFLTNRFILQDGYNNQWLVKVSKSGDHWYFDDWKDFCSDNKLEPADYVTFDYKGNHKFEIKILGLNMCQKKGLGATIKKEQVENDQGEETQDQVADGIEDSGESEDEERSIPDSEEIRYCGESENDTSEDEFAVQVPKKSKAKFQPKLKACDASSSRGTETPVSACTDRPRRTCAKKTAEAIKRLVGTHTKKSKK